METKQTQFRNSDDPLQVNHHLTATSLLGVLEELIIGFQNFMIVTFFHLPKVIRAVLVTKVAACYHTS